MPAPPIPTNQSFRPSKRASAHQLLRDDVGGVRARERRIASPICSQPRRVGEELVDLAPQVELGLRDDDRSTAPLEVARVLGLVVGGRVRVRDEQRRPAGGGDLPDRSARAGDDEIGGGESGAEVVRERGAAVVGARDAARALVVALAGEMEHGRPAVAERLERGLVQPLRALAPAEDEDDRPLLRKLEAAARLPPDRPAARARRDRPADDRYFGASRPSIG